MLELKQQLKKLQPRRHELQQKLEAPGVQKQQLQAQLQTCTSEQAAQQLAMVSRLEVGRTKTDAPAHTGCCTPNASRASKMPLY
jgi:Tfp pilus assembly protein FimV